MTLETAPIVARCLKCGREFVTLPQEWPAFDAYFPQDTPTRELHNAAPCRGEIVLVDGELQQPKEVKS